MKTMVIIAVVTFLVAMICDGTRRLIGWNKDTDNRGAAMDIIASFFGVISIVSMFAMWLFV